MKPKYFKEAQIELKKPESMTDEECSSLWVCRHDGQCISLWKASFWERINFLIYGNLWCYIRSGETQPPVGFAIIKTIF